MGLQIGAGVKPFFHVGLTDAGHQQTDAPTVLALYTAVGPILRADFQGIPAALRHLRQQAQKDAVAGCGIDDRPGHHFFVPVVVHHARLDGGRLSGIGAGYDDIGAPVLALEYASVRKVIEIDDGPFDRGRCPCRQRYGLRWR